MYDERFAREYGPWRPVVAEGAEKFLACGVLEHGFARIAAIVANWHPHLHLLVTDGGFRPNGTFVSWPAHDTTRLTEAFRRAVLRLFVRLELF